MEINCGFVRWASVALALSLAACDKGPTGPQSGALRVAVVTTGVEIDPDGYTYSVDGGTNQPITANGAVVIGGLAVGSHTVALSGLAANCTLSGANSQSVRVTGTDTATAFFQVACTSTRGILQISATTTGSDLDANGYGVLVQRGSETLGMARVGPNQTISIPEFPAGSYTATIVDVAGNCTLNGPATRTFTITAGATTQLPIQVTCTALPTILGFPFTDPAGDTLSNPGGSGAGAIDLLEIRGSYKADSLIMTFRFAAPVLPASARAANSLGGWVEFDTDENTTTGMSPATNAFGGNAALGVDYVLDLFSADSTSVDLDRVSTGGSLRVSARFSGDSLVVRIPLSALGNDDGNFKFAMVFGTEDRPTDIAPNAGVYAARRPGSMVQSAASRMLADAPPPSSGTTVYRRRDLGPSWRIERGH